MQKGYNSDINLQGSQYHVQTEDWGSGNPFFVTQVFRSGAVVRTFRIPYTKVLPHGLSSDAQSIRIALETQHKSILDLLVSGQLL
jgi:hypothetical protein